MFLPVVLVSLLLFRPAAVVAARAADPVSREALLSLACSAELRRMLAGNDGKIDPQISIPVVGRWPVERRVTVLRESGTHPGQLEIGPYWLDRAGAIPRDGGARYEFISESVAEPALLPRFWRVLAENVLARHRSAGTGSSGAVARQTICGQAGEEELEVLIFRSQGEWFVILRQGPVIPELRMSPLLD